MATHSTKSILEEHKRPSGGLCGPVSSKEEDPWIDWEPGEPTPWHVLNLEGVPQAMRRALKRYITLANKKGPH